MQCNPLQYNTIEYSAKYETIKVPPRSHVDDAEWPARYGPAVRWGRNMTNDPIPNANAAKAKILGLLALAQK